MKRRLSFSWEVLAIVPAIIGFCTTAHCQVQAYDSNPPAPQISATGKATLDATADTAQVRFVIEYDTNNVAADQAAVDKAINRAFTALEYIGVSREAIRASAINISPIYTEASGTEAALNFGGFRAQATVDVDLQAEQLNHVANVVDAVMKTGASRLDGITFGVSPNSPQRTAVITQATQDAQGKARAMAASLGVQITSMEGAGEGGVTVTQGKPTPDSSANNPLKLEASVTVYYQVSPVVASANNELPY